MKKMTIKDIAKMAGVDHSTVSRSLNDSPRVAEETKKRIQKIAKEVGFEYNHSARALSSQKTGTIALIFSDSFVDVSKGTFMADFMWNIHKNLEKESYNIILDFIRNEYTGESNIKKILLRKKVDGLLIVAANEMEKADLDFIQKSETPCIMLHNKYKLKEDVTEISTVFTDHLKGGYLATKYLIDIGHKKIITYTHEENGFSSMEFVSRMLGYQQAIKENGLKEYIIKGDINFKDGDKFVDENFELIKSSDAIFVQTDVLAIAIIQRLRERGLKVPEDISIVGYDDIELSRYMRPSLTTIHQPKEEAAKIACKKILELVKDKKSETIHILMEPKLIIRDSTKERI